MYLDPRQHAAITGSPLVRIAATEGAEFWAFDGRITARILALSAGRQIVQTWRSFEWRAEDVDGTLILTFSPDPAGGRIESGLGQCARPSLRQAAGELADALLGSLARLSHATAIATRVKKAPPRGRGFALNEDRRRYLPGIDEPAWPPWTGDGPLPAPVSRSLS